MELRHDFLQRPAVGVGRCLEVLAPGFGRKCSAQPLSVRRSRTVFAEIGVPLSKSLCCNAYPYCTVSWIMVFEANEDWGHAIAYLPANAKHEVRTQPSSSTHMSNFSLVASFPKY